MAIPSGVHEAMPSEIEDAKEEAARTGAQVFSMSTAGVDSRAAFFDRVRDQLPLDPPLVGSTRWDALSDSLWGGIDALDASDVAIFWESAKDFRSSAPDEFEVALEVFRRLASSLGQWSDTWGDPKNLAVYVSY